MPSDELIAELDSHTANYHSRGCGLGAAMWGNGADPDVTDAITYALDSGRYSDEALSRFLKARGHHVSRLIISRHRTDTCTCRTRYPEAYA